MQTRYRILDRLNDGKKIEYISDIDYTRCSKFNSYDDCKNFDILLLPTSEKKKVLNNLSLDDLLALMESKYVTARHNKLTCQNIDKIDKQLTQW